MTARDIILSRIRSALSDVTLDDPATDVPVEWQYGRGSGKPDVLETFVEMVLDYKAVVKRVSPSEVPATIAGLLTERGVRSVVVPAGVDEQWRRAIADAGVEILSDEPPLSHQELNVSGGVVTASAVAIAETGTIVLDHRPDQGRRALTLVPDLHVCVVRADQVVSDVPEAVGRLASSVTEGNPLTWISGGSATSDIELNRVEGVHGPRTLLVVLAE